MANKEHVESLVRGVEYWNAWVREQGIGFRANLSAANLSNVNLKRANLRGSDFSGTNLSGANLWANLKSANLKGANLKGANFWSESSYADFRDADFRGADLRDADLRDVDFRDANLGDADFRGADLRDADLRGVDLSGASLRGVDLRKADLSDANLDGVNLGYAQLRMTNFVRANLRGANLTMASLQETVLADADLSGVRGLDEVNHFGPSTLNHRTIRKSSTRLPDHFLRGCGLSDWQIVSTQLFREDLSLEEINDVGYEIIRQRSERPIQLNPIFISYSHKDSSFIERIEEEFDGDGIRFWRDVHDGTAGRLDRQIERAINLNPIVFLVLSKNSVESDWVEWEAAKARKLEKEQKRDVLCPVALDEAWKTSDWDPILRRQIERYNILDFKEWEDEMVFVQGYEKLRKGLRLFYQGETDNL